MSYPNSKLYRILLIVVAILAVICIGTVIWTVSVVMGSNSPTENPQPHGTTGADPTNTTQQIIPTTQGDTMQAQIDTLIEEASFIAAGYDYQKAISMVQSSAYYSESTELQALAHEWETAESKLVPYSAMSTITHIFFHSLIADPARAFDGDVDEDGYNLYMTTIDEFIAILEEMYARGFVLISPYDMAYEVTDEKGTRFVYGDILLPEGKTPFLMSQDDLNYYSYMIGTGSGKNETPVFVSKDNDGFAHKLVIGSDGYPTCEYMDAEGNLLTGSYDLVPVLEDFIQEHPDFSYRGARAILGVTGYEGVFGYRTKPSYEAALGTEAYQTEVQAAKEVAQCLRDHGWILASHSYGHPAYGEISLEKMIADSDKWEDTVQPIIGETDVILFPYGSDIHTWHKYTFDNAKFKALYEDGYRYFFNVDAAQYWNQLGTNYFRGGRRNLDGYRLYHHPNKLSDLFDAAKIIDPARPLPVPTIGGGM